MRLASISLLICLTTMLLRAAAAEDALVAGIRAFESAFEAWSGPGFARAASSLEGLPASTERDYWIGVSRFHEMLQKRTSDNESGADAAMEASITALEKVVAAKADQAEAHALLGTLYGMKINGSMFRAIRFGPSVERHRKAALEHGPNNPRVLYLVGVCQFHTQRFDEAVVTLAKAAARFESQPTTISQPSQPAWGKSSCICFLGQAHEKAGRKAEALECFQKALRLHAADRLASAGIRRLAGN